MPGWDGVAVITSVRRGTAVGVLLCVAGAAILAAVKWGLKDDGLVCVAVMLTALLGARALAAARLPQGGTATRALGIRSARIVSQLCAPSSISSVLRSSSRRRCPSTCSQCSSKVIALERITRNA